MIAGLKRVALAVVLIAALGAAGYYGWRWYDSSRVIQMTDNAYIRGEITGISSRVTGYAVEVLVDDNMPVKADQVLVRIDPRDFRMTVEKSQAALDQAKATLAQVGAQRELEKSKIVVAEASLRAAEAQAKNAEIVLKRATDLLQKGAGTQAAFDSGTAAAVQASSTVDQAEANLAYEREQLTVIDANEAVAKAQVDSAEAALLSAKFALGDTEVWAPIDGIVANRKTRVGEYVTAGTRMLAIVPIDNLWIEANYRETQIERMKVGDPVRIDVDTHPGKPLCGYVESIAPASGSEFALIPPDNATGNFTKIVRRFTVRIRFNASESNAILARPGMSVESAVAVSTPDDVSPTERGRRVGCSFDPDKDVVARPLTKLPEHPGLGRARPQGAAGTQVSPEPAR
ncbi:membrane fusion protein, multidrug efflux system [Rhizobiales bacterium GAS113]|nr:membrane fusion protein, multidrug efflux system [Rhizobiales bacterium GAS113]